MSATTSTPAELAARISGRVVTADDADWDVVRSGYNLAADLAPAAIVLAADADDVVAAVAHARAHGLHVAGQATGHNAAAHAGVSDTLVVDVRDLRSIAIDVDARRVRVGAGVRWRDVVPQLSDLGLAALHGSSPDVGIAGYSLGGGMGWLARKHGLQANSVVAFDVVTADGELHRVDAGHRPDLFWALRGGNGNFGVVTAIEFTVYPAPDLYAGGLFFPLERADEVLATWTRIAPDLPEELMSWTTLYQFPDAPEVPEPLRGGAFAVFHAAFLGSEREGAALVAPVRELGAVLDTFAMVAPIALADMAMDPPDPLPYRSTTALLDDLSAEAVGRLLEVVGEGAGSPLPLVQIRHLGGALARTEPGRRGPRHDAGPVLPVRPRSRPRLRGGARGRVVPAAGRRRGRAVADRAVPQLRGAPGRRQHVLRRGHLAAAAHASRPSTTRPGSSGATTGSSRPPRPTSPGRHRPAEQRPSYDGGVTSELVIETGGLTKSFGQVRALAGLDLRGRGR